VLFPHASIIAVPSFLTERLATLRARLRPDPAVPPRVWARRRWKSLSLLVLAIVVAVAGDAWLATCGFKGCPTAAEIRAFRPAEGGRILDRNAKLVGRLVPTRRLNVPLAKVPTHVRNAFIATEDRRFYAHNGLDWRGVGRAVLRNVRSMGVREGFSTITMQVARNTFVVDRMGERSLQRKLIELRLSRTIEKTLTKDQILELYLNVIYMGNGVYGVEGASRDLFGKSVSDVSLSQGAMLAALPKGPSAYTPRRSPARALKRRNLVLSLMVREGYLASDRALAASKERLTVARNQWRPDATTDSYALDAVRSVVDSIREARGIESTDITVRTTIDMTAQRAADRAVGRRAAAIGRDVEGAMVALDPRTGEIRALVGGREYERGNFNRALNARRQPGSAFKPFVYAAALQSGLTPATLVDDDPVEIQMEGRVWTPANYDGDYGGRLTMRRALMRSANAATVRISRSVGEPRVVQVAHRNGITSDLEPVPSIALGALEVTPLELVAAYAPFANGGWRVQPRLVRSIEAADGTVLWTSAVERTPAMDPRDAYQLTSMLRSVVDRGTGRPVRDYGAKGPIAGKTGTTNDGTDVWFVGYTPTLVAGFWFGHDDPRSIGGDASGGRLAAPAWADFYVNGWKEAGDENSWKPPAGLVMRVIDAHNGTLANEWCPVTQEEWFRDGTEPVRRCEDHTEPPYEPEWDFFPDTNPNGLDEFGRKVGKVFKRIFKF
jgi:1A family penicillin-binding protein